MIMMIISTLYLLPVLVDADIPTDSIDAVHELKEETIGGDVITRVPEQVNTAEQDVAEFISVPDSDSKFTVL